MSVSLFCRLSEAHPQAIAALHSQVCYFQFSIPPFCLSSKLMQFFFFFDMQYRMCAAIMELSNALIYGNRLRCGSTEIQNAKLNYNCSPPAPSWLMEVFTEY